MVTEKHAWSEATAQWIRKAVDIGMSLFGDQLMAHVLGGKVDCLALLSEATQEQHLLLLNL